MKKKIIIIAAVAVVALLVVLKMRKNVDPGQDPGQDPETGTGDEGKPNVKPANRLKIIRANFTEIEPENGVTVQPANSRGNIV